MTDKSGGDVYQESAGGQLNGSSQDLNSVAAAGAGVLDSFGGAASSMGTASQYINQNQNQSNNAYSGSGGDDNVNANTTISIA